MEEEKIEITEQPVQTEAAQPAEAAKQPQPKKSHKGMFTAILTCSIVLLCLQGLLLILYLFGLITLFGDPVDLNFLLETVEALAHFNTASMYYSLTGLLFGIVYLVMFTLMVRTFVLSLKSCKYLKRKTVAAGRVAMTEFSERLSEMFFVYTCIPLTISALLGTTHLSGAAVAMLIAVPLMQVAVGTVERFASGIRPPVAETIFEIGKKALLYASFSLLAAFLRTPAFHDFIRGAVTLFNGNIGFRDGVFPFLHLMYLHIVSPVLYVVMLALAYRVVVTALLEPAEIRKLKLGKEIGRAVIFAGVVLGTEFLFGAFLVSALDGFSLSMFGDWFLLVRESRLPVFSILLGYLLLEKLWGTDAPPAKKTAPAATGANQKA